MKNIHTYSLFLLTLFFAVSAVAETVVDITGAGAAKKSVAIDVSNRAFANCLKRNLELSGLFAVQPNGGIKVSGAPGAISVTGGGKSLSSTTPASDDKSARMAARKLSDAMCEAYGQQKGFACDRVVFVNRKGANNAELCMSYPDGLDIRQLTADATGTVGPRWMGANTILYTSLKSGPQIWEYDVAAEKRRMKWSFKGLTTGAAVSPDGKRVAIILSFQGNPELYVIEGNSYTRLTNTKNASEGCPAWSPDGKKIVYMSDETRSQQLWIIDVATKAKRRLTSKGRQNMEPDWGKDGRIVYNSSGVIKVIDPAEGEGSARAITKDGGWKHPSWARDGRHVVAASGKVLFVLDTMEDGDAPRGVFNAKGNWGDPCWAK